MNHPYWTTLTVAVGLIALAAVVFLGCLARWAWIRGSHAADRHRWDESTHVDWDAVIERINQATNDG